MNFVHYIVITNSYLHPKVTLPEHVIFILLTLHLRAKEENFTSLGCSVQSPHDGTQTGQAQDLSFPEVLVDIKHRGFEEILPFS